MKIRALTFLFCFAIGVVSVAHVNAWLARPVELPPLDLPQGIIINVPCLGPDEDATPMLLSIINADTGGLPRTYMFGACVYRLDGTLRFTNQASIELRGEGTTIRTSGMGSLFQLGDDEASTLERRHRPTFYFTDTSGDVLVKGIFFEQVEASEW